MDSKALKAQFQYLRKIRRMGYMELRAHHDEVFEETKWQMRLPRMVQKETVVRRCFFWFCLNNYHYPPESKPYKAFAVQAKRILRTIHASGRYDREEAVLDKLAKQNYFSKKSILAMPIAEVDRYLTVLGIWADVDGDTRRRLLWSWFHQKDGTASPESIRRNANGRVTGVYCLRDIVVEHPDWTFAQFKASIYGERMPTTTPTSWHNARWWVKKYAGVKLPKHPPGTLPRHKR